MSGALGPCVPEYALQRGASSTSPPFCSDTFLDGIFAQWNSPTVWGPLAAAIVSAILFVVVELKIALEPILAPFLLREKVPVLVGISNFLVATCNFTIMYNFPTWFQTVLLTSASEAGTYRIKGRARLGILSALA